MAGRGINKVILIGNLGGDPEVRYTGSGLAIANVNVATSDRWRDRQSEENRERTEWHRVVLFDKLAEIAGEYLRKGSQVYIEGRLQTRKWQDRDGNDRYTTEIVAREMTMLGGRGEDQGEAPPAPERRTKSAPAPAGEPERAAVAESATAGDFDDDIPF